MRASFRTKPEVRRNAGLPVSGSPAPVPEKSHFSFWLILVAALVILGLIGGGGWFYQNQRKTLQREAEADLKVIAQFKVDEVVRWRSELKAQASEIMGSPFLIEGVARWMTGPTAAVAEKLSTRLRSMKESFGCYDILLVDPSGQVLLSLGGFRGPCHEEAARALAAAIRERRVLMTDLHSGPRDLPPHIDTIAPLFIESETGAMPIGALVLQSDARRFLYPLIKTWPRASRSSETMLVRREGDSALYLNELRYQANTALTLRIPLSRKDLPAVRAVLGEEGVFSGLDYRGVEVLAVLMPVPDSPWFMVAKIDKAEALAVWRSSSMLILGLILGFAAAAMSVAAVIWQRNQKANYRNLFRAETALRESEKRYRTTLLSVGDAVITTDYKGRVELMNPVAEALTGWKQEEAQGRPLEEVFHIINEETRGEVENPVRRVVREGLVVGLANHSLLKSRDGVERAIADSGAPIWDESGRISGVVLVFRDQTAERAAAKALRESEERFRSTLDNMIEGCQIIGFDWRYLYLNEAAARHGRRTREELLGHTMMEGYPGIEQTEMFAAVKRCLEDRICNQMENEFIFPDGTRGWFQLEFEAVPEGVFIMSLDITERRRAEEALRRSEEKYRILHDYAGEAIFVYDTDLKLMEINRTACALVGKSKEELIGRDVFELAILHPDDIDLAKRGIARILEGEKAVIHKMRFRLKDGGYAVFIVTSTPVLKDGNIVAITNICRDITEEERLLAALETSERRFRALFESGMDAMFVYKVKEDDTPSSFLEVNTVACEKLGYSREELLKLTPMDIRAPEDPLTTEEVVRSLSLDRAKLFERLLITRDGQRIPMEVNARLFELNGVPTVIAIARDITQRKKDEEQLRAALKEREVMLREIHHRVKNNIQIISSLLRLQSQPIKDEKILEIFRESQSRIRSMALIHEKLYQSQDFSRIDFSDYIEKMVTHLFALYNVDPNRIRLRVEAKDVQLDINRAIPCGLIINELVTNALKHAFPGDRQGELAIVMQTDEGGRYRLTIKDTGIGLPEEFDLSQSKTLGFQIVRDLVKQLDGTVEVKRDGGTEFVITCYGPTLSAGGGKSPYSGPN